VYSYGRGEEVERVVQVERVAGEEVPHHELVDALLVLRCRFWNSCNAANFWMFRPFGRIASGRRPSSRSASYAVTSDTVVNTVDACAAARIDRELWPDLVLARLLVAVEEREVVVKLWLSPLCSGE
jgi:hypothetical protein